MDIGDGFENAWETLPIREMSEKQVQFLEGLFEALQEGHSLCVHDPEYQITSENFGANHKFIGIQSVHVIGPSEECKAEVNRSQYGPK